MSSGPGMACQMIWCGVLQRSTARCSYLAQQLCCTVEQAAWLNGYFKRLCTSLQRNQLGSSTARRGPFTAFADSLHGTRMCLIAALHCCQNWPAVTAGKDSLGQTHSSRCSHNVQSISQVVLSKQANNAAQELHLSMPVQDGTGKVSS